MGKRGPLHIVTACVLLAVGLALTIAAISVYVEAQDLAHPGGQADPSQLFQLAERGVILPGARLQKRLFGDGTTPSPAECASFLQLVCLLATLVGGSLLVFGGIALAKSRSTHASRAGF